MNTKKNPPAGNRGATKKDSTSNAGHSTLEYRLELASHGFHLFPLIPATKRPAVRDWENHATTNPRVIESWSALAGTGIACGPSGLVVLDLDAHGAPMPPEWQRRDCWDGRDAFCWLWARNSPGVSWAHTFNVETPTGGGHVYFRAPVGRRVRNSAGRVAPQVDVRGHGGYVVAPGTTLPSGSYTPLGAPSRLMTVPGWLTDFVDPTRPARARLTPQRAPGAPYTHQRAERRVQALVRTVSAAVEGQRNSTLNWAAWQLSTDGLLGPEQAVALANAGMTAGLSEHEAVTTVMSAAKGVRS